MIAGVAGKPGGAAFIFRTAEIMGRPDTSGDDERGRRV